MGDLGRTIQSSMTASVNRAARTAIAQTSAMIRKKYNVKKRDLDRFVQLFKAQMGQSRARVYVSNKGVGLFKYGALQGRRGVTAAVVRGQRRLYRASDPVRGSFIAKMNNTHEGVFLRSAEKHAKRLVRYKTKKGIVTKAYLRAHIKELFGPSAMQLYKSEENIDFLKSLFLSEFEKNFIREAKYRIIKGLGPSQ